MIIHQEDKTTKTKKPDAKEADASKGPGNLKKHFGKLQEAVDGLSFQKKVRNEWK